MLLLGLPAWMALGCSGSHRVGESRLSREAGFTLSASPSTLSVPAGGSGYLTVSTTRFGSFAGEITLSVPGLPGGVTASGSIAAGASTGRLTVVVDGAVAPVELGALGVTGTSGTLTRSSALTLEVSSALPASSLPAGREQAAGALQTGGSLENRMLVLEPVGASSVAQDSAGSLELRHGFLPVPDPALP
nr:hypothetical protein [uncultured Holophaga sp.]